MDHTLTRFFDLITDHSPAKTQLPSDQGTLINLYDYLSLNHESLSNHKVLKSEILQVFREIGNATSLTRLLEETMFLQKSRDKLLIHDIVSYGTIFINNY